MTYNEVLENARKNLAPMCKVCPDCNGLACKGQIPGVGGTKSGRSFIVCREFLNTVKIHMDTLYPAVDIDMSLELFGKSFNIPFFMAPIGGMAFNYPNYMTDDEYSKITANVAQECGTLAFTGDSADETYFLSTLPIIKETPGVVIATVKPWKNDKVLRQIKMLEENNAIAFAMDVDSAALVNLKRMGKPVFPKSVEEIKEITSSTKLPFIVKGVMTPQGALKCAEAGAYGIIVSNHGGRVMEDTPAPASMLPEIRAAVGDSIKIIADGGIRSGADVFKVLALGADAVLIGRPYAIAAHGGREEGVKLYTEKIAAELSETMMMANCPTLKDITPDKIKIMK